MNYLALYEFYFPAISNFLDRKYVIMPQGKLAYWMRELRPIKIQRVR